MNDEDTRWNWHDQRGVTWAAGLAAVALIVILVWAVMRTATGSSLPGVAPPAPSAETSAPRKTRSSSTTSYPVPSVQTSQGAPTSAPPPPPPDVPTADEPTNTTPTTTPNPYVTTTTQNGGAV